MKISNFFITCLSLLLIFYSCNTEELDEQQDSEDSIVNFIQKSIDTFKKEHDLLDHNSITFNNEIITVGTIESLDQLQTLIYAMDNSNHVESIEDELDGINYILSDEAPEDFEEIIDESEFSKNSNNANYNVWLWNNRNKQVPSLRVKRGRKGNKSQTFRRYCVGAKHNYRGVKLSYNVGGRKGGFCYKPNKWHSHTFRRQAKRNVRLHVQRSSCK